MKAVKEKEIRNIIKDYNIQLEKERPIDEIESTLTKEIKKFVEKKAILGIDLYRYSQYKLLQQSIIPFLINDLLRTTITNCSKHEPFIFQHLDMVELEKDFIDMGDGGFLIFDNPLEAVVFVIYFQANVKRYNSNHTSTKDIRNIIGPISLRYCVTLDDLYGYNKNHYGSGIINNARILAKDKLNRFLIDKYTIDWFDLEMNGIENLTNITSADFEEINLFKNYKSFENGDISTAGEAEVIAEFADSQEATPEEEIEDESEINSVVFFEEWSDMFTVDVLHIGEIKSKLDIIDIYSIHLQIKMFSGGGTTADFPKYTISIGNLNSSNLV